MIDKIHKIEKQNLVNHVNPVKKYVTIFMSQST